MMGNLMSGGCFIDRSEVRCRAYIFPGVINYPVTFLRMRDKRKPVDVQRNAKHLS